MTCNNQSSSTPCCQRAGPNKGQCAANDMGKTRQYCVKGSDPKDDDDKIFGFPALYVYIAGGVGGGVVLLLSILVLCKICSGKKRGLNGKESL